MPRRGPLGPVTKPLTWRCAMLRLFSILPLAVLTAMPAAAQMADDLQYREAAEMLARGKKPLLPTSYYMHNTFGAILQGAGDYAGAIEHYSKALEANPKFIDALRARGLLAIGAS